MYVCFLVDKGSENRDLVQVDQKDVDLDLLDPKDVVQINEKEEEREHDADDDLLEVTNEIQPGSTPSAARLGCSLSRST